MGEKRSIAWFKQDLRLHDNEMLVRACAKAAAVIPVYILDPRQYTSTSLGFPKTGSFRAQFILESIFALQHSLRQCGSDLYIFTGHPEDILPALAREHRVTTIYTTREVTHDELLILERVEQGLRNTGASVEQVWQNTLYHLEDIPWPIQHLPDTFTQFRKEAEQEAVVRKAFAPPPAIPSAGISLETPVPDLCTLGLTPIKADPRVVMSFQGGEDAALQRVQDYIWDKDLLRSYKLTRDGLIGADYSSKLSPWLAAGCISPRSIYEVIKQYESERIQNESTYWLIFELMWRDYFRFAAKKYGHAIFLSKGLKRKAPVYTNDHARFDQWRRGETGNDFIDANMRELLLTGFMSNRGRQNVASFLVHQLKVNWTWGAMWFESQLIDYDVSSNWLNWAYLAGVGNDPRPDRQFNTESQVKKYDPHGHYTQLWLPDDTRPAPVAVPKSVAQVQHRR